MYLILSSCILWLRYFYVWMDGPFEYLDPKFVEEKIDHFNKEFLRVQKYYRNRIKQDMLGTPVCKFKVYTGILSSYTIYINRNFNFFFLGSNRRSRSRKTSCSFKTLSQYVNLD